MIEDFVRSEGITKVLIASDVGLRNGIGIEVYLGEEIVLEIFRDYLKRTRELSVFKNGVSLEVVEWAIARFKEEIPWEFEILNHASTRAEA